MVEKCGICGFNHPPPPAVDCFDPTDDYKECIKYLAQLVRTLLTARRKPLDFQRFT